MTKKGFSIPIVLGRLTVAENYFVWIVFKKNSAFTSKLQRVVNTVMFSKSIDVKLSR